ncbi:hypothetical protein ACNKXS_02520 [Christiangramia marina]|uniref:hypothetical protein n=1 Tax=Christiangramia marina TaxID=409436 RepID=UPI003AA818FB
MNKVRLLGLGMITFGILIGYLSTSTNFHLISGVMLGLGVGWTITGRFGRKHDTTISGIKTTTSEEQTV